MDSKTREKTILGIFRAYKAVDDAMMKSGKHLVLDARNGYKEIILEDLSDEELLKMSMRLKGRAASVSPSGTGQPSTLRSKLIRLAHQNRDLRKDILGILVQKTPDRTAEKMVKIWEVLYDGKGSGPAGDGTYIYRTRNEKDALKFAKANTAYGSPAVAKSAVVPYRLAQRWGLA